MKTPKDFLFLFALLAAAVMAAEGAETRLIPFDEFYLSVPVEDVTAAAGGAGGMQVAVRVSRGVQEPLGGTKVEVSCPGLSSPEQSLDAEEVAVFLEVCAAAGRGEVFRQEVRSGIHKTVYEAALVEGAWRVRMRRGGEVLFAPQEAARLKEQALAIRVEETDSPDTFTVLGRGEQLDEPDFIDEVATLCVKYLDGRGRR